MLLADDREAERPPVDGDREEDEDAEETRQHGADYDGGALGVGGGGYHPRPSNQYFVRFAHGDFG